MTTNDDNNYWRSNDRIHKGNKLAYTFHRDLSLTPDLDIISAVGLCIHEGCTARTYAMTEQGLTAWALVHWEYVHTTGEGGKGRRPSFTPSIKWVDIGDTERSLRREADARLAEAYKRRKHKPRLAELEEEHGITGERARTIRRLIGSVGSKPKA